MVTVKLAHLAYIYGSLWKVETLLLTSFLPLLLANTVYSNYSFSGRYSERNYQVTNIIRKAESEVTFLIPRPTYSFRSAASVASKPQVGLFLIIATWIFCELPPSMMDCHPKCCSAGTSPLHSTERLVKALLMRLIGVLTQRPNDGICTCTFKTPRINILIIFKHSIRP